MPIELERIKRDMEMIAGFTETPGEGATRPTFTPAWGLARDYLLEELNRIDCQIRIDAAGNVHARLPHLPWDQPAWGSGSHLDTVPHGGNYDGVMGVVVPLEIMRTAHDQGRLDLPLELIAFTEEEGPTFGLGMLGSRALVGDLHAKDLAALLNKQGQNYWQAGSIYGVCENDLDKGLSYLRSLSGFIEVHAEQGPGLWKNDKAVALVTAIAGRHQYKAFLQGQANHAGSTSMKDRHDALAGAAEIILALEALAGELSENTVITVGEIHCLPNSVNVIPDSVTFTIDFRSPDNDILRRGDSLIAKCIENIATNRSLRSKLENTEKIPAVSLDAGLAERMANAAERCGLSDFPEAVSGALHDAAVLASHMPTVMLFVASKDGISHNPGEYSRYEDIACAAKILWEYFHEL